MMMSPRSEELNETLRAEARAKIMEAALTLFGEHGYDQTSVRMIARAAGISQGLMYNYFAGKEQLLAELFRVSMRDVRESFALASAGAPEARVEGLIRGAFAIIRRNQKFWRLSYGVRMQPAVLAAIGPDVPSWLDEIQETVERYLHEAAVPNARIEAEILFALIDGVAQHYVLDPQRYPLDEVTETLVARYRALTRP
jgi:AcrR family transcriptional regulator